MLPLSGHFSCLKPNGPRPIGTKRSPSNHHWMPPWHAKTTYMWRHKFVQHNILLTKQYLAACSTTTLTNHVLTTLSRPPQNIRKSLCDFLPSINSIPTGSPENKKNAFKLIHTQEVNIVIDNYKVNRV